MALQVNNAANIALRAKVDLAEISVSETYLLHRSRCRLGLNKLELNYTYVIYYEFSDR
jgi:hypothetical protein